MRTHSAAHRCKEITMKVLRSIFAFVFVLSLTLMSVAPASASAVSPFTGIGVFTDPYFFGEWPPCTMHGVSEHCTDGGAVWSLVATDNRVDGELWAYTIKAIYLQGKGDEGPLHGSFEIKTAEGVVWEGTFIAQPPINPIVWLFTGHGKGSNAGLTLKMTTKLYDMNTLDLQFSGQVVGK
jgi:hypothetical protein